MSAARGSSLRAFRRPRLWLAVWGLAIAAVVVLSLTPPPAMSVPRNFDKVEHLVGYGGLSAFAVLLFAGWRGQVRAGLGLVALGVALEFAQALLTRTRMADPADALANATGVALGLLLALTPAARWLQRLDARLR
ncbi:VanZ family protein [Lysobacter yangpyeongensis]|uniref:VanZ family protein n=1 Tax=Lysobacter yangpyeongensis TaxID=346182 RepID=A0ABW0SQD1_9GAMM